MERFAQTAGLMETDVRELEKAISKNCSTVQELGWWVGGVVVAVASFASSQTIVGAAV